MLTKDVCLWPGCETRCGSTRTCSGSGSSRGSRSSRSRWSRRLQPTALDPSLSTPISNGLEESRRRRLAAKSARKRRLATRTVPAMALVLGSATMLPIAAFRQSSGGRDGAALQEDPPSLTFRLGPARLELPEPLFLRQGAPVRQAVRARLTPATVAARVDWHRATSVGLPYAGHLVGGTQLPVDGAGLGHLEPGHGQRPEPRLPALRQRAHDPHDHLRLRRLPRRPIREPRSWSSATSASATAARWTSTPRTRTASTSTSTTRASTGA